MPMNIRIARVCVVWLAITAAILQFGISVAELFFAAPPPNILERTYLIIAGLLLIPTAMCEKFPRRGTGVFFLMLTVTVVLCANTPNFRKVGWNVCWDDLKFALFSGGFLLSNLGLGEIEKRSSSKS